MNDILEDDPFGRPGGSRLGEFRLTGPCPFESQPTLRLQLRSFRMFGVELKIMASISTGFPLAHVSAPTRAPDQLLSVVAACRL